MTRLSPQDLDAQDNAHLDATQDMLPGSPRGTGSSWSAATWPTPREKPKDTNMVARPGKRRGATLDQIERSPTR